MAKSTNSSTATYAKNAGTANYSKNGASATYSSTANYSKNGASATYSSTATYAKNVASHDHDDYFSKDKNTKIDIVLNSIVEPGIYQVYCSEGINTAENYYDYPEGSSGVLTVIRTNTGSSSTVIRQTYYRYGTVDSTDYGIYTRQIQVGGTIGTWVKVITAKDFVVSNGVLTLKFL